MESWFPAFTSHYPFFSESHFLAIHVCRTLTLDARQKCSYRLILSA
jgi:hypothetical protein